MGACETITALEFKGIAKANSNTDADSAIIRLGLMNSKRAFICAFNDENFNQMLPNCIRCWNSIRFRREKIIRRWTGLQVIYWVLIRREEKIFPPLQ
ncbi:hypothetical protein CDAR_223661 [Caerostris darwini]|uniref:Uncharacterized protein n=1 Tax=Caerostris darwini TaxID=1538125 RepID=A0AAV4S247_9ARAC|nr:hypothetical protein CDAR_223661 [Caerostris darwini]